jgi:hypothetical protein
MSQNIGQTELQTKTRRLLDGPLKHIRVVALAAALLPLASVAAAPVAGQCGGSSGVPCPTPTPPPLPNQPGTGTPGYWKNHASAWPSTITVANVTYTKEQAIAWLGKVGSDKTITMFSSLVPAMLNVALGNDPACVADAIATGNSWLIANPLGTNVSGSSPAWVIGEPTHIRLDTYNNGLLYNVNGLLCAPHRQ